MKPGITGLWQVSARQEGDFDRWVEKDLEYIDHWSLWLDCEDRAADRAGDAPPRGPLELSPREQPRKP